MRSETGRAGCVATMGVALAVLLSGCSGGSASPAAQDESVPSAAAVSPSAQADAAQRPALAAAPTATSQPSRTSPAPKETVRAPSPADAAVIRSAPADNSPAAVPVNAMLAPELVEGYRRTSISSGLTRPLLDPCGNTRWPSSSKRTAGRSQTLSGPEQATIVQQLFTYTSEQAAAEAVAEFERASRGCARRPDGQGGRWSHAVQPDPRVGSEALMVRVVHERPSAEPVVSMVTVFRRSHGVTLIETADGTGSVEGRYEWAVEVARLAVGQMCHLTSCD